MIYTAVDWSGDPGIPSRKSAASEQLVFAFVSINADEREHLHRALEDVRKQHRKTDGFIFHFVDCPPDIADTFFRSIRTVNLQIRVGVANKRLDRVQPDITSLRGQQRLLHALTGFSVRLPSSIASGHTLLIDAPKNEKKLALSIRRSIRDGYASANRVCFQDIRLCPDGNDPDGEIVQVADMVAGAVRRAGVMENAHTRSLGRRIVNWED